MLLYCWRFCEFCFIFCLPEAFWILSVSSGERVSRRSSYFSRLTEDPLVSTYLTFGPFVEGALCGWEACCGSVCSFWGCWAGFPCSRRGWLLFCAGLLSCFLTLLLAAGGFVVGLASAFSCYWVFCSFSVFASSNTLFISSI